MGNKSNGPLLFLLLIGVFVFLGLRLSRPPATEPAPPTKPSPISISDVQPPSPKPPEPKDAEVSWPFTDTAPAPTPEDPNQKKLDAAIAFMKNTPKSSSHISLQAALESESAARQALDEAQKCLQMKISPEGLPQNVRLQIEAAQSQALAACAETARQLITKFPRLGSAN